MDSYQLACAIIAGLPESQRNTLVMASMSTNSEPRPVVVSGSDGNRGRTQMAEQEPVVYGVRLFKDGSFVDSGDRFMEWGDAASFGERMVRGKQSSGFQIFEDTKLKLGLAVERLAHQRDELISAARRVVREHGAGELAGSGDSVSIRRLKNLLPN